MHTTVRSLLRHAAATWLMLACVAVSAQTRRAVVVGVGEHSDPRWPRIHGDRDVPMVTAYLDACGYTDVTTLVNAHATKAAVVQALHQLAARCAAGDVVYIHFSGHGQQVTDTDGDETDGWDESWITYDAAMTYGEHDRGTHHLTDDEVNALLTGIVDNIGPGGRMLVVVDACHAGDSTRGTGDDTHDSTCVRGVYDRFILPRATSTPAHPVRRTERWLTLSACQSYQLNHERRDTRTGLLTSAVHDIIMGGDSLTLHGVAAYVERHRGRLPQTPVLTGVTDAYQMTDVLRRTDTDHR